MKKISTTLLIVLLFLNSIMFSQETLFYNTEPGLVGYGNTNSNLKVADGNSTIATSYTQTACGLSYTQASVFLSQKSFTFGPGMAQPATLTLSGLPYCQNVLKAFLYVSTSGTGTAISATIKNPQNSTASFSMAIIGQGQDVCWGYGGSTSYRADVTSIVSGAGVYTLSGIPVGPSPGNDAQGATLFVIYKDVTQNYSGSIVIADGCATGIGGLKNASISGFNVCGTPNYSNGFVLVSDLQRVGIASVYLNDITPNYTIASANQNAHDFVSAPGTPITVGQTTANYGVSTGGDCYNFLMAGAYFRTSCLTCSIAPSTPPNTPTIAIVSSSNIICSGNTVTLTASGATTYSWSNGSNNASIVVSPTTTTTYWVYSNNVNGCSNAVFTQSVNICNGIKEYNSIGSIKIYPNPSTGIFKIQMSNKIDNGEVNIYNSIGQLILNEKIKENQEIDLSKFSKGYYICVIRSEGKQIHSEKIIIQ